MILTLSVIAAVFIYLGFFRPRPIPPVVAVEQEPPASAQIELAPIETEEEREVRLAKEALGEADRVRRNARGWQEKEQEAVRLKLQLADKYVRESGISVALPRTWEAVMHWGSWINMPTSWTAPEGFSEITGSTGPDYWTSWRFAERSYRISFAKQRNYLPDDFDSLSQITLETDGEVATVIDCARGPEEHDRWRFTGVDALKVGPWMAGFVTMEAQLSRSLEFERLNRLADMDRERASRISLDD